MQRLTMELGATVLQDWYNIFEPRVLALATDVMSFDYAGASTRDMARYLHASQDTMTEVSDIHMRVNIPPMNAVFGFEEFIGQALGDGAVGESRGLLQGFDNRS